MSIGEKTYIYTLRYLREPQIQRNVRRSQNLIEAYHQLRSIIAQIGGKKELQFFYESFVATMK